MGQKIYQLKVSLHYIKPSIWRRILVESDTSLEDLHKILQTCMGWTNSHLNQFTHQNNFYSQPNEWDEMESIDYTNIKTDQLLKKVKDKMIYEYDFGDGWTHNIVLEDILEKVKNIFYPVCIGGKRACPPEDCGGFPGYMNLLEVISDPKHEEYEDIVEWLGEEFDPEEFDKEDINEALKDDDFGVISF